MTYSKHIETIWEIKQLERKENENKMLRVSYLLKQFIGWFIRLWRINDSVQCRLSTSTQQIQ